MESNVFHRRGHCRRHDFFSRLSRAVRGNFSPEVKCVDRSATLGTWHAKWHFSYGRNNNCTSVNARVSVTLVRRKRRRHRKRRSCFFSFRTFRVERSLPCLCFINYASFHAQVFCISLRARLHASVVRAVSLVVELSARWRSSGMSRA